MLLAVAFADQQAAWREILRGITGLPVYMGEPGSDLYVAEDGSQHPLEELIAAASTLCKKDDGVQPEPDIEPVVDPEPIAEDKSAVEVEPVIEPQPIPHAEAAAECKPDIKAEPVVEIDPVAKAEPTAETPPPVQSEPPKRTPEPEPIIPQDHPRANPQAIPVQPPKADAEPPKTIAEPPSTQALANALASLQNPLAETEAIRSLLIRLLEENRFMEAIVLLKAVADAADGAPMQPLYAALLHAVNPPMEHRDYTSAYLNEIAGYAPDPLVSWAQIGFMLWAACFPQTAYDYDLHNTIRGYCDSLPLNDLLPASAQADALTDAISHALILLCDDLAKLSFAHLDGRNFSAAVRTRLLNESMVAAHRSRLQKLASERLDTPRSSIHLPMDSFFKLTIGPASSIGQAIAAISAGAPDSAALSQRALGELSPGGEAITDAMLQKYIDDNWNELRRQDTQLKTRRLDNGSKARNLVISELENRIQIMNEWLQLCGGPDQRIAGSLQEIKSISGKVQKHFADAIGAIDTIDTIDEMDATTRAGLHLLKGSLGRISRILGGAEDYFADPLSYFAPLLATGYMLLDSSGSPLLDKTLGLVPGMEPWRLMLLHIGAEKIPLEDALRRIEEPGLDPDRYEDYGSACLIRRHLQLPEGDYAELSTAARNDCCEIEESFKSDVRLACAYGQIAEATKETVFSQAEQVRHLFISDTQPSHGDNYAHFRMLLRVLRGEIDTDREANRRKFMEWFDDRLQRLSPSAPRPQMLDLIEKELQADNFAMAEEYFNRYDSGEMSLPSDDTTASDVNFHQQFLENAEWYREQCDQPGHRGSKLRTWGSQMLRRSKRNFWSAGNERNADSPLDYWPIARDVASTASDLTKFLRLLGLNVDQVTLSDRAVQYEVFKAQVRPVLSGLPDYAHPVAKFGTLLQSPLNVVCLYGCKGADTLIDILAQKLQLGTTSIVLLDGALNMVERRKVAAKFKSDTSGQNAFLLIDRVLILYLSALDQGVRLNAMLQCTLPYTYDQLYTNGTGSVPDEMFIGRLSDRKALTNINGTCLVYGGRQLGKTALLQRVTHLCHNENQGHYAIYIDIKDKGYEETVRKLKSVLMSTMVAGAPLIGEGCQTLEDICDAIAARKADFNQLTLFFDEVDCFLDEIAPLKYTPLHPLVVLRRDALANRFKFVLAGTHNVAATANAIKDNSDILQLGNPLCIEPLSMADATRLIKLPLSYLGFEIGSRQIALILANTNSYPGLIHLFCNALVTSVCDDYAAYYSVGNGNPPYQVTDEQLKAIFRQTDIKREISRRVMATIELDRKYHIVANLMAFLEYSDQDQGSVRLYGYTPAELLECNIREFQISDFMQMNEEEMGALMEEMQRMGILWKQPDSLHYRFRQRDFLGYIGDSERVTLTLLEGDKGGDQA